MKKMLVIGNGFDLEHKLKTSYKDFITFYNRMVNIHAEIEGEDAKVFFTFDKSKIKFKDSKDEKDVYYITKEDIEKCENNDQEKDKNFWIDYIKYICEKSSQAENEKWYDIENHIKEVIESLAYIDNHLKEVFELENPQQNDSSSQNDLHLHRSFETINYLVEKLKYLEGINRKNIEKLKNRLYEDLEKIMHMLELYLRILISDKKLKSSSLFKQIIYENTDIELDIKSDTELNTKLTTDYFISFNYTHTLEEIYRIKAEKISYIHGKVTLTKEQQGSNIVFGIGKEIKGIEDLNRYDYIRFQKYYQRVIKQTDNQYKEWLSCCENEQESLAIFIFGHSLDETDGDVIRNLIECKVATIYIFYLNSKALGSIITNLIKIIGEDELVKHRDNKKINFIHNDDNAINNVKERLEKQAEKEKNKQQEDQELVKLSRKKNLSLNFN